jgi:hypothetical protein
LGFVYLNFAQFKFITFAIGMNVEQQKNCVHSDKSNTVDYHQCGPLLGLYGLTSSSSQKKTIGKQGEEELQRINVEEDDKKQDRVQQDGEWILQAEATKEFVVPVPYPYQHGKAKGKANQVDSIPETASTFIYVLVLNILMVVVEYLGDEYYASYSKLALFQ